MIYDAIVIGGGITGAGVVRDLALRGLKVLLLEKGLPGCATTAASTHLIHGGLRYLLYDRLTTHTTCWDSGHIVRMARPLLKRLPILWPVYQNHQYGLETVETLLESYDVFQPMKEGLRHLRLSAGETLRLVPGIKAEGLCGAVVFDEWWVDPVALVQANLDSANHGGAVVRENTQVIGFVSEGKSVCGVKTINKEGQNEKFLSSVVVNAAGPWAGSVAGWAGAHVPLRLQQGTHLVYEGTLSSLGVSERRLALLLEASDHKRFVFVVPGNGRVLVGPTDVNTSKDPDHLTSDEKEVRYLLSSVQQYFPSFPERFLQTIVGARPVLGQKGSETMLSRDFDVFDHSVRDKRDGLLTVTGGKMSDFRLMGQETGDAVCRKLNKFVSCQTHLNTLQGMPVDHVPDFSLPPKTLKTFLRHHPHLRKVYAMSHLAGAFGKHLVRKYSTNLQMSTAEDFQRYYLGQ